ncbi:hypothetical protein L218DRAFT_950695 [Marasmius fiardii PR-910]|nr:hypothetical protein L218DRAFT_950695 [Marasmius fiardii PR-910]
MPQGELLHHVLLTFPFSLPCLKLLKVTILSPPSSCFVPFHPNQECSSPHDYWASEVAHYKWTIDDMKQQLARLKAEKKTCNITAKTTSHGIWKIVAMFSTVGALISEHNRREDDNVPEDVVELQFRELEMFSEEQKNEQEEKVIEKCNRDRNHTGFELLLKSIPGFKKKIENPDVSSEELLQYFQKLEAGVNSACTDDINTSKEEVVSWLEALPNPPSPRLSRRSRVSSGFKNKVTGALICPPDLDFDDPETQKGLQDCVISLSSSTYAYYLPVFYRNEQVNLDNVEDGYLQGDLLVKMFKMVFTLPGSVDELPASDSEDPPANRRRIKNCRPSTKKNVAQILDPNTPTPRSIAYCAVLTFNYEGLYNSVVDYFEEVDPHSEDGRRINDLLIWWKRQVFSDAEANASTSSKPLQGHKDTLQAQRRARRSGASSSV